MNNSKILRIKNAEFSGYYFDIKQNVKIGFQIYIIVPLISLIVVIVIVVQKIGAMNKNRTLVSS